MKKESKKLIAMIMSMVLGLAAANFTYAADTAVQETGNGDSHNESVTNEAVEVEAIGLKSAYATGETINIKARVTNKGSESLRIWSGTCSFGKAGVIYAQLTGEDGSAVDDNYFAESPAEYFSYLNVNEYIEREYIYDTEEATPGAYTLEVSFYYRDDNNKSQKVSKKYDVEIGLAGGTEYEEDEITGGAAFLSDKAGEIKEYTDELSRYPLKYLPVKLYAYPGAKYYAVANDGWHYDFDESLVVDGIIPTFGLDDIIPIKVYTDENGKVWGYVKSDTLPNKEAWYCMSSPRDNLTNNIRGDINHDQKVDLDDATLVLKKAVGIGIMEDDIYDIQDTWSYAWLAEVGNSNAGDKNADVNEDGKVDLVDAKTVLKIAVGISEDF